MTPPPPHRPRVKPWGVVRLLLVVATLIVIAVFVVRHVGDAGPAQATSTPADHPAAPQQPTSPASTPPPSPTPTTHPPHQVDVPGLAYPLAKSSCISFPPTHGNRHQTVALDAGHGGHDPGTHGTTSSGQEVMEKDVTLPVAKKTAAVLRQHGYTVVLTRTADSDILQLPPKAFNGDLLSPDADHKEILARVACANAAHAAVLVSIHFNSYGDPSVGGAQTHYDHDRPFGKKNHRLARLLQHSLIHAFHSAGWPVPDRGLRDEDTDSGTAITERGAQYGHLLLLGPRSKGWNAHPSSMPGALVEPLFLSRPTEADVAVSDKGQRTIATGIADAVQKFLRSR